MCYQCDAITWPQPERRASSFRRCRKHKIEALANFPQITHFHSEAVRTTQCVFCRGGPESGDVKVSIAFRPQKYILLWTQCEVLLHCLRCAISEPAYKLLNYCAVPTTHAEPEFRTKNRALATARAHVVPSACRARFCRAGYKFCAALVSTPPQNKKSAILQEPQVFEYTRNKTGSSFCGGKARSMRQGRS